MAGVDTGGNPKDSHKDTKKEKKEELHKSA
jgi:hypothetical protein